MPIITSDFLKRSLSISVEPQTFEGMTTNSQQVKPGFLFLALKGGHRFIEQSLAAGATGVLFQKGEWHPPSSSQNLFLEVEDSLAAYRKLATAWRLEFNIPVIAVAGSAGKTTTKELLFALLKGKWTNVLKTQGSQNGFDGIPHTLMQLESKHSIAVIEIGIDEIGAMEKHMAMVCPTHAVLTSVGPEHLEKLRDVPTVAHEESIALSACAAKGGWITINMNDPWIKPLAKKISSSRKTCFSLHSDPEADLIGILNSEETLLTIRSTETQATQNPYEFSLRLPLQGKHNAANLLAATSIALQVGLSPEEIQRGLASFTPPTARSSLCTLPKDAGSSQKSIQVLCDYYNAQPASMKAGLEVLSKISHQTRTQGKPGISWACLGDMLELGTEELRFHRELASPLCDLQIQKVFLYGPRMKILFDELKLLQSSGKFRGSVKHFESQAELSQRLQAEVQPGDVLLIKGSRGMAMENVYNPLEIFIQKEWSQSN